MKSTTLIAAAALSQQVTAAWWQPKSNTTWQIELSTKPKAPFVNVATYDFDLFDNPASTITALHNQGRKVICYFSAGSYEEWRPDAKNFTTADRGDNLDDWPGERWINTRSTNIRKIMQARLDLAVKKGCDAVDPDNIDAYENGGGGFSLTTKDAIDYVTFLANEGHKRGLAVGLKNGGQIVNQVVSKVEFQVNEQCVQYKECNVYRPFITANKPVFNIEYREGSPNQTVIDRICKDRTRAGFSTLIKHMSLDAWYKACPATTAASSNQTRDPEPEPVDDGNDEENVANSARPLVGRMFGRVKHLMI